MHRAKHSSLSRIEEWQRLAVRDTERPDFLVLTGNDLAIDMVMYGSDYLLGLSTMAPDLFARRDALWAAGDPAFHELNDVLQYLGFFAFRAPVPAYKHDAAMFLHLPRLDRQPAHPSSAPTRPESDRGSSRRSARAWACFRERVPQAEPLREGRGIRGPPRGARARAPLRDRARGRRLGPLAQPLDTPIGRAGNRFAILPMEGLGRHAAGWRDGPRAAALAALRQSGAKLIWGGEAVAVRADGRANPRQLVSDDSTAADLARLREELVAAHESAFPAQRRPARRPAAHPFGALRPPRGRARTAHRLPAPAPGRAGRRGRRRAPARGRRARRAGGRLRACRRARPAGGLQFVDVKHCHGYLLHELLSAHDRPGPYGGDLAGRTRFLAG